MWGDETRRTGDFLRLGDLTLRGTFGGDFNLDILHWDGYPLTILDIICLNQQHFLQQALCLQ